MIGPGMLAEALTSTAQPPASFAVGQWDATSLGQATVSGLTVEPMQIPTDRWSATFADRVAAGQTSGRVLIAWVRGQARGRTGQAVILDAMTPLPEAFDG